MVQPTQTSHFLNKCYTQEEDVKNLRNPRTRPRKHTMSQDAYANLLLNKAIKTVHAHKEHRKQRMHRVEGLVGLLEANPLPRGSAELKKEIENFIDKSNDITAGLQYLILHKNSDKGIERYEKEM